MLVSAVKIGPQDQELRQLFDAGPGSHEFAEAASRLYCNEAVWHRMQAAGGHNRSAQWHVATTDIAKAVWNGPFCNAG